MFVHLVGSDDDGNRLSVAVVRSDCEQHSASTTAFDGNVSQIVNALNDSLHTRTGELNVVAAFYNGLPSIDNKTFTSFVYLLRKDNISVGLCELYPRISVPTLEKRLRAEVEPRL